MYQRTHCDSLHRSAYQRTHCDSLHRAVSPRTHCDGLHRLVYPRTHCDSLHRPVYPCAQCDSLHQAGYPRTHCDSLQRPVYQRTHCDSLHRAVSPRTHCDSLHRAMYPRQIVIASTGQCTPVHTDSLQQTMYARTHCASLHRPVCPNTHCDSLHRIVRRYISQVGNIYSFDPRIADLCEKQMCSAFNWPVKPFKNPQCTITPPSRHHIVKVCIAIRLHWSFWQIQSNRIALRVGGLQWVTINYSFVIQAVIQFVTQAVPADVARGRGIIKIGRPLRRTGVRVGWAEGGLRAVKCMLNPCSDYDDA